MGRERHAHLPVKTQCFAHVGISCELGTRKKWDERRTQHLPVKTQCFLQFGLSCKLGNRKNGREAQRLHLPVKTQCFVHLGISCGTVSFSDVFTSFGLQTLLWKHQCACCWSASKLRKTRLIRLTWPCQWIMSFVTCCCFLRENISFFN